MEVSVKGLMFASLLLLAACRSDLASEVPALESLNTSTTLRLPIVTASDDAEGSNLTSTDLDLGDKDVRLAFTGLSVPMGATITSARVQFKAHTAKSTATALSITGPNGVIKWSVPAWRYAGHRSAAQLTPELAGIVKVTDGKLILNFTGTGHREAKSFDSGSVPPTLLLSYTTGDSTSEPEPNPDPEPDPTPEPEPQPDPSPVENGVSVTALADSGAGSLRACVEASSGPRTCVFRVAGTITLKSRLRLRATGVTLAGETAPAPGITLTGDGAHDDPLLEIKASDFEVRHLRFRRGPGGGHDNITIASTSRNGYIHHNSITWATDENINTYRDVHNVTIAYNIIAEPLHCSTHPSGCHGKSGAMGKYETGSQSIHHNLIMSAHDRSVQIAQAYGVAEYVNNVHYNNYDGTNLNGDYTGAVPAKGSSVCINVIGNTWLRGPNSQQSGTYRPELRISNGKAGFKVYLADNQLTLRSGISSAYTQATPCPSTVSATSASLAYEDVLENAGAWPRDATDARLINEVKTNTGAWKNSVP